MADVAALFDGLHINFVEVKRCKLYQPEQSHSRLVKSRDVVYDVVV
ncbi:hypothetical protein [Mycolicibacterium aubagnense]|uniref:Uncharacterized protein n=1 Tax=Mycolicibacterium aubagnense TaxID=319707 RepID=A0ABN5YYH2_9MYCO|nr:hypothetical protein [Mycolicibacterium aubagnense]BBX86958.1 hypothetical protein MAUB_48310 [Mycolicibacterium aubagnense]